ncbi:hypothetical protein [Nocardioides sp. GY 10127]|uniref:hypothetical protein n=1 Tax=Nocardioides sp. GY 10127 TaxID=2569762 RepID=UPI0010A8D4F1|nr:hypothetical protein [Nocardioides sp. GY 10127]TIC85469.1 hypothetical protein E8D37_02190 [Nocardioides sp. GY 10127]
MSYRGVLTRGSALQSLRAPDASWRVFTSPRRLAAAALLAPGVFLVVRSHLDGRVPGAFHVLVAVVAVLTALTVASYLPDVRHRVVETSWTWTGGLWAVVGLVALSVPPAPVVGLFALLALLLGLVLRLSGGYEPHRPPAIVTP